MMAHTPAAHHLPLSRQSPRRTLTPSEYTTTTHGIHTHQLITPHFPSRPLFPLALPDWSGWAQRASAFRERLPLLWRFVSELERKHSAWFWGLVAGNLGLGLIPAGELVRL